jgi:hypothetical protein
MTMLKSQVFVFPDTRECVVSKAIGEFSATCPGDSDSLPRMENGLFLKALNQLGIKQIN